PHRWHLTRLTPMSSRDRHPSRKEHIMTTLENSLVGSILLVACGVTGCTGDGSIDSGSNSVGDLSVTSATKADGFRAMMDVGDETILIASVTEGATRHASVKSSSGTSYADWSIALADFDVTGTFGDRTFGRFEDR